MIINNSNSMQQPAPFDQNHTIFTKLLNQNVKDSKVNYQGFIDSPEFDKYLESLDNIEPEIFNNWTEQQKIAFWINAYNAFTIKAIIDHYPIERSFTLIGIFYAPKNSILQIPGVWKKLQFRAVGQKVTLDHIEHGILRKEFNEPRIHVAINCASISCPDLRDEAYVSDNLEYQLNDASQKFVRNTSKGVEIDKENNRVKVSKIFKWFGEDFYRNYNRPGFMLRSGKQNGTLGFIYDYIDDSKKDYILNSKYILKYLKYDWGLNEANIQ